MHWVQVDNYYHQSDRSYRISRALVSGVWKFSAWAPPPAKREPWRLLGITLELEAAKRLCEDHFDAGAEGAP